MVLLIENVSCSFWLIGIIVKLRIILFCSGPVNMTFWRLFYWNLWINLISLRLPINSMSVDVVVNRLALRKYLFLVNVKSVVDLDVVLMIFKIRCLFLVGSMKNKRIIWIYSMTLLLLICSSMKMEGKINWCWKMLSKGYIIKMHFSIICRGRLNLILSLGREWSSNSSTNHSYILSRTNSLKTTPKQS